MTRLYDRLTNALIKPSLSSSLTRLMLEESPHLG